MALTPSPTGRPASCHARDRHARPVVVSTNEHCYNAVLHAYPSTFCFKYPEALWFKTKQSTSCGIAAACDGRVET